MKRQHLIRTAKGKRCILINGPLGSWSISQFFTEITSMRVDKVLYHAIHVNALSDKLIDEILECPDFDLGNLWVVFWDNQGPERLELLIREQHHRGMRPPCTREPLIMCETDGDIIYWVNPNVSESDLELYLKSIVHPVGWQVCSVDTPPNRYGKRKGTRTGKTKGDADRFQKWKQPRNKTTGEARLTYPCQSKEENTGANRTRLDF